MTYGVDEYKNLIPTGRFLGSYTKSNGGIIGIDLSEVNVWDFFFVSLDSSFSERPNTQRIHFAHLSSVDRTVLVFKIVGSSTVVPVSKPNIWNDIQNLVPFYSSTIYSSAGFLTLYAMTYRDQNDVFTYVSDGMSYYIIFLS